MPRKSSSGCASSCITSVRCGSVRRELARPQPLELAHADQRVVVDGVDVERVVRDQAVEVPELGDERLQHAELVHLEERLVRRGRAPRRMREERVGHARRRRARAASSGRRSRIELARRGRQRRRRGAAPRANTVDERRRVAPKTSRPVDR